MEPVLVALLGVVVVALLSLAVSYNRFVRQRVLIEEAWSGIDVELTRRHDLVPNLVRTVQAHAAHEREVLAGLVAAREAAAQHRSDGPTARQAYEDQVTAALAQVLARTEAYPELRSSTSFLALQEELTHTEDRIAAARRFYNGNVRAYNTRTRTFPSQLVAAGFGFAPRDFFELRSPSVAGVPHVGPEL